MTMASAMKRYLKILFGSKKKGAGAQEGPRRITARLPVLNDPTFDEEGSEETVRQAAVVRTSKGPERAESTELKDVEFKLLREICCLHSDVEIP